MKRTVNKIYCFVPMAIYLVYSVILSLRFGSSYISMSLLVSTLAFMIYLVVFFSLKKEMLNCPLSLLTSISLILTLTLAGVIFNVGEDRETALISGAAIHTVLAFCFVFVYGYKRTKSNLAASKVSGKYFIVKSGERFPITDNEARTMRMRGVVVNDLSHEVHGASDNFIPINSNGHLNNISAGPGSSSDTYINPSSGLPMNGGISGLDIAGNSWGTNFNDPTTHQSYDPNRGY
ncbi:hypothetical protein [Enterobacter sp. R4-368]|uniref:hypothetical protein n=1 Tax=Enterobacter sp. R4-368 TaxID=1166130 RepID=UPI0016775D2C|nr:hypothetical protein [Enterobacter sp. R4-368]